MKIKVLAGLSGMDFSYYAGQEVEIPDDEALAWIEGGVAEVVTDLNTKSGKKT